MPKNRRNPSLSDIDLRLLKVFNAVVEAGGFASAEIKLNKSKSGISTDIAALEERLGVKLCHRGRRGFALTSYGKEIHSASLKLFAGVSDFRDRVGRIISNIEGEFTVALDDNFLFGVRDQLVEVLHTFTLDHPNVFFNIRTTSSDHVTQLVLEGNADIGISVIPRLVPEVLLQPLFKETMLLYCGARHPLFTAPAGEIDQTVIAKFNCVDFVTRQTPEVNNIAERMRVRARAATMNSRLLLILTGNFLEFLPPEFAQTWVDRSEIRMLPARDLCCESKGFAIIRRDAEPSAAREYFIEELNRAFAPKTAR
jgi:DNA-binding transcriptional LysR family regulator